jgi:hypothetical protein
LAARTRWPDLPGDAAVLAEGDTTVDLAAGRGNVEASGYRRIEIDACRAWRIAGYALFAALSDALNSPFVEDGSGSTPAQNWDYTLASSARDRVLLELRISGQHAVSADVAPVRSIAG